MSPWWLLIFLAMTLIGITKSGFGSGVGLMIVPMTVVAMGHLSAGGEGATLGLILPLLIIGDMIAVAQYRRLVNLRIIARLRDDGATPGMAHENNWAVLQRDNAFGGGDIIRQ